MFIFRDFLFGLSIYFRSECEDFSFMVTDGFVYVIPKIFIKQTLSGFIIDIICRNVELQCFTLANKLCFLY